jgi:uncharacterized membrane protein
LLAAILYSGMMGTLATWQYRALHVPHGDSGMYEEHLWNVLHGKGFRSQIDDGRLFLGEHLQVFHLALIPIYLLWPSLEILQITESVALASGAVAIYFLARGTAWPQVGVPLAIAYLLYFPLQYLNLEMSWKTFRPEAFGVPLLLWGLMALERRRFGWMSFFFLAAISSKEDFGITTACIGFWLVGRAFFRRPIDREAGSWGVACGVFSAAIVVFVVQWMIPYFRGDVPHFSRYFEGLGDSPVEVATKLLSDPPLLVRLLTTSDNLWYVVMLLGPLLFTPFLSPTRFAVTLPTFAYLMLSTREGLATPWFHFHAPLIPIFFWAIIAGAGQLRRWVFPAKIGWAVMLMCLITGAVYGRTPLSASFYNPSLGTPKKTWAGQTLFEPIGSYYGDLFLPNARSKGFEEVQQVVTPADRVAATDYVRSRFTHFQAAYVYPEFRKHMTIDDVDVLVIDRTEGWWGREPNNPDKELLVALARQDGEPKELQVRGRPFRVVLNNPYWWVARQIRPATDSSSAK